MGQYETAIVVGAGFEGLATAHYLAKAKGMSVTLVDRAAVVGAVMRGFPHEGFHLDIGCQVFDNFDARVTDAILDLGDHAFEFGDISYASRSGGVVSADAAVPDLTYVDDETLRRLLSELEKSDKDGKSADTLVDFYTDRFGPTAAGLLERVNLKCLAAPADELDQTNRIFAGLSRIRMVRDTDFALKLKLSNPMIDQKLAVPRSEARFYETVQNDIPGQNLIPVPRSFGSFCDRAPGALERLGVSLRLGEIIAALSFKKNGVTLHTQDNGTIDADFLVWCSTFGHLCDLALGEDKTAAFLSPIGTTITYYFAPADAINPLGYLQNYDEDMRFFRWSSMGLYSRQVAETGESFCCIETPSEVSLDGDDPEGEAVRDWDNLKQLNLMSGEPSRRPLRRFFPGAIRRRRPGYAAAARQAQEALDARELPMVYMHPDAFGRTPTARTLFDDVDKHL